MAAESSNDGARVPETPIQTDIRVGCRLRKLRLLMGLTQGAVGAALGVSFQQIQKYETGANCLGASRLHQLAEFLGVPASYFFRGDSTAERLRIDEVSDETIQFHRAFRALPDPKIRKIIADLVALLARETH